MTVYIVYMRVEYDEFDCDQDVVVFHEKAKAEFFIERETKRDSSWTRTLYEREVK